MDKTYIGTKMPGEIKRELERYGLIYPEAETKERAKWISQGRNETKRSGRMDDFVILTTPTGTPMIIRKDRIMAIGVSKRMIDDSQKLSTIVYLWEQGRKTEFEVVETVKEIWAKLNIKEIRNE